MLHFLSVEALLGLQFLLSRTQALQENASKFSFSGEFSFCFFTDFFPSYFGIANMMAAFSDQLQPFFALVSSWQKLELMCWPALLDGVMEQCDANAGKVCDRFCMSEQNKSWSLITNSVSFHMDCCSYGFPCTLFFIVNILVIVIIYIQFKGMPFYASIYFS